MEIIILEGELLNYFHQFMKWVKMNKRISDPHYDKLKARAILELHNDANKWYHEKDFDDLYTYCFFKTA